MFQMKKGKNLRNSSQIIYVRNDIRKKDFCTVRMTDTEMAQKTHADVHGLGENQYYLRENRFIRLSTSRASTPVRAPVTRPMAIRTAR